MKPILLVYIILLLSGECLAQANSDGGSIWSLESYSGVLNVKGLYRDQKSVLYNGVEAPKTTYFSGGFKINTKSSIWHPNFLTLELNGEFNPNTSNIDYLVLPDVSEVRAVNRLDLKAIFLTKKPINFSVFAKFNQNYTNRENLTSLRTKGNVWGGKLVFKNRFLPLTIRFKDGAWEQKELETGRVFKNKQKSINAKVNKSFTTKDRNVLIYNHDEYFRQDISLSPITNITDYFNLKNDITFDRHKKYTFASILSSMDQRGSNPYKRLQSFENLSARISDKLRFKAGHDYNNYSKNSQYLKQNNLNASLYHKLYKSLKTKLFMEYSDIKRTGTDEFRRRIGIDFKYIKKIPTGQLSLSYRYFRYNQKVNSSPVPIQFFSEEYTLTDDEIVLLDHPFVERPSIRVKNESGTIIYQENFDYILIERGDFYEIQRFPGGQIENNTTVYIDYVAIQPGSYKYDVDNRSFNASIMLFKRLIEFYFRSAGQSYKNVNFSEFLILNEYSQRLYGGRLEIGTFTGGVEYENYKSSIIPFELWRYYIKFNFSFRQRLMFSMNGNYRDYKKIGNEVNQRFLDVSGRFAYRFSRKTNMSLDIGVRNQKGAGIDLELFRMRTELTTFVRQLYFTVGFDLYKRVYVSESINYKGAYFAIERRF